MTPARPGHFVWHDWRPAPARRRRLSFYEGLLGWRSNLGSGEDEIPYTILEIGGRSIGGVVPLEAGEALPSHWISYLAVSDLGRITRRAVRAGGTLVVEPTHLPGRGYFAVIRDPWGAMIAPVEHELSIQSPPEILSVPTGHFCWAELWSPEPARAVRFYEDVLDWHMTRLDPGEDQELWLINPANAVRKDHSPSSGIAAITAPRSEGVTGWISFFVVEDIEEAQQWSCQHDGSLVLGTSSVPSVGFFAVIRDPEGAVFGLFQGLGVA